MTVQKKDFGLGSVHRGVACGHCRDFRSFCGRFGACGCAQGATPVQSRPGDPPGRARQPLETMLRDKRSTVTAVNAIDVKFLCINRFLPSNIQTTIEIVECAPYCTVKSR